VNNSGTADLFDIDSFVVAVGDGAFAHSGAFAKAYPGIQGCAKYHADCNCDGVVDLFDIDPFVERISDPDEWHTEYECESGDCDWETESLGGGMSARDFAAWLAANQGEAGYAWWEEVAETLAESLEDEERAEFWADVYTAMQ